MSCAAVPTSKQHSEVPATTHTPDDATNSCPDPASRPGLEFKWRSRARTGHAGLVADESDFVNFVTAWPTGADDLLAVGNDPQTIFFLQWQRDRALEGRMIGYRRAAKLLAQQVVERGDPGDLDTVFFPYASMWRHYMELRLKSLVLGYRVLLDEPRQNRHTHSVLQLWRELRGLMDQAGEDITDEAVVATGGLLTQLDTLDPSSEEFRYDTRKDGTATLGAVQQLDYVHFHGGLEGAANVLEAIDTGLGVKLDTKQDLRDEYEAELQSYVEHDRY